MFYIILRNTTIFWAGTKVLFGLGQVWNLQRNLQQNPNAESNVGTPLTSLGPALVANSLCRAQERRTMRETEGAVHGELWSALDTPNDVTPYAYPWRYL
jgi:hypothetical protein